MKLSGGIAHFCGLQSCGSVHACPVCGPKIRQKRAVEIDTAAGVWMRAHGPESIALLTLTLPHDKEESLRAVLDTVRDSFSSLVSGRAWQEDKRDSGVAHYIVGHDSTVGANGWHPHLHIILFCGRPLDASASGVLGAQLLDRWTRAVTSRGRRAPSPEHGLQLEVARNRRDVADYICQVIAGDADGDAKPRSVAMELARGDLKSSRHDGQRTPWQVLQDLTDRRAADGEWTDVQEARDKRDLALWAEWEQTTKGLPSVRWSRGLRAAVLALAPDAIDATAASDADVAAADVGGELVYAFGEDNGWAAVIGTSGGRARVLRAAESGGAGEVAALVDELTAAWLARQLARDLRRQRSLTPGEP